jgi:hypothetical protein
MQRRIRPGAGANSSVPAEVRAWLYERRWWDDRLRLMAQAAALRGGPIEMADEPLAADRRPAEHV